MSLLLFFIVIWNSHVTYVFVFGKYGYFILICFKKSVRFFQGDASVDVNVNYLIKYPSMLLIVAHLVAVLD